MSRTEFEVLLLVHIMYTKIFLDLSTFNLTYSMSTKWWEILKFPYLHKYTQFKNEINIGLNNELKSFTFPLSIILTQHERHHFICRRPSEMLPPCILKWRVLG